MEEQLLTAYLCFWLAVLGAVLGSFLDCAASRWAAGDPHPFAGRSRCSSCGHALGTRDLVPVFSFLLLWGGAGTAGRGFPPGARPPSWRGRRFSRWPPAAAGRIPGT